MKNINKTVSLTLLGLDFGSPNFGCAALGYSFLDMLEEVSEQRNIFFEITSVNYHSFKIQKDGYYRIKDLQIHYKSLIFYKRFIETVKKSDFIFDFTGGDSFTDIYGTARFLKESILKQIVISHRKKLILGPQTIGPFHKSMIKKWATYIIKNSEHIFVRDKISEEYVKDLEGKSTLTTDIAFVLSSEDIGYKMNPDSGKKIGLNVSALMMNNGYSDSISFKLKINYIAFCERLISELEKKNYEIHLIAHVLASDGIENDYALCEKFHSIFPNTIIAPRFQNPMQAKAYLGKMDCVIGSRMHATIGAFSMGVPIIAISYSRKFQGLFNSLGYQYIIDVKSDDEETALYKVFEWVNKLDQMKTDTINSMELVRKENNKFSKNLGELF